MKSIQYSPKSKKGRHATERPVRPTRATASEMVDAPEQTAVSIPATQEPEIQPLRSFGPFSSSCLPTVPRISTVHSDFIRSTLHSAIDIVNDFPPIAQFDLVQSSIQGRSDPSQYFTLILKNEQYPPGDPPLFYVKGNVITMNTTPKLVYLYRSRIGDTRIDRYVGRLSLNDDTFMPRNV